MKQCCLIELNNFFSMKLTSNIFIVVDDIDVASIKA